MSAFLLHLIAAACNERAARAPRGSIRERQCYSAACMCTLAAALAEEFYPWRPKE